MTVRSGFGEIDLSGLETDDGKVTAGLGVLLILLGVTRVSDRTCSIVAGLASAVVGVVAAFDLSDVSARVSEVDSDYVSASTGWGLYVVVIAGIVGMIGSIRAWPRRGRLPPERSSDVWAPPTSG